MAESTTKNEARPRKPRQKPRAAPNSKAALYSDIAVRIAMLGVSLGSLAQLMGYNDLGHMLLAVGGACGVPSHTGGK